MPEEREDIKVIPKYAHVRELTVENRVLPNVCVLCNREHVHTTVQTYSSPADCARFARFVRAFRSFVCARARTSATLPIRFVVVNCRHGRVLQRG